MRSLQPAGQGVVAATAACDSTHSNSAPRLGRPGQHMERNPAKEHVWQAQASDVPRGCGEPNACERHISLCRRLLQEFSPVESDHPALGRPAHVSASKCYIQGIQDSFRLAALSCSPSQTATILQSQHSKVNPTWRVQYVDWVVSMHILRWGQRDLSKTGSTCTGCFLLHWRNTSTF